MDDPKTIDRRTLLGSSLAWAAVTLSGCSDKDGSGGTAGAGGGTGGTGGNGSGGAAGTGGSGTACTHSMTGTHMHPLTIPGSDIDQQYSAAPYYLLEDGGTGHTHQLALSAYDFAYLHAGATRMIDSSTTNAHLHTVTIMCTLG